MELPNVLKLIYRNMRVNTDVASLTILIGLPGMYLVFFGFGFKALASSNGGGNFYLAFLAPGIMAFQAVMAGSVGGGMLWADRRWGMLSQLLVAPFTRVQYLLGIMLTAVLFGLGGALTMLAMAYIILGAVPFGVPGLLIMLGAIAIGSIFFGSLMLLIAALVKSNNAYNSVQILVLFLVNFASTVFYPFSNQLPLVLQALFLANPLTYIADIVRGGFFSSLSLTNLYEFTVLSIETVITLFLATRAYMRSDVSME